MSTSSLFFFLSVKSVVPQYFKYQFSPNTHVHWVIWGLHSDWLCVCTTWGTTEGWCLKLAVPQRKCSSLLGVQAQNLFHLVSRKHFVSLKRFFFLKKPLKMLQDFFKKDIFSFDGTAFVPKIFFPYSQGLIYLKYLQINLKCCDLDITSWSIFFKCISVFISTFSGTTAQ